MRQDRGSCMKIKFDSLPGKGRCVVATCAIEAGDLIECCPVILFHLEQDLLNRSGLGIYHFEWDDDCEAIVLGLGSLYNHSFEPNARFIRDYEQQWIKFIAARPIAASEEITINYNYYPGDCTPMAFEVL
ncbi:MAG: SET domain-containing protein-lysine N-methyltransferase [Clostridia bacterium]|nr:SET domain-containing protein-lysine N-methyltransferase [Clostridia bacterium]